MGREKKDGDTGLRGGMWEMVERGWPNGAVGDIVGGYHPRNCPQDQLPRIN
jgi:hypothetical protein